MLDELAALARVAMPALVLILAIGMAAYVTLVLASILVDRQGYVASAVVGLGMLKNKASQNLKVMNEIGIKINKLLDFIESSNGEFHDVDHNVIIELHGQVVNLARKTSQLRSDFSRLWGMSWVARLIASKSQATEMKELVDLLWLYIKNASAMEQSLKRSTAQLDKIMRTQRSEI